jgi:hypothetical protein
VRHTGSLGDWPGICRGLFAPKQSRKYQAYDRRSTRNPQTPQAEYSHDQSYPESGSLTRVSNQASWSLVKFLQIVRSLIEFVPHGIANGWLGGAFPRKQAKQIDAGVEIAIGIAHGECGNRTRVMGRLLISFATNKT